jgi:phosphate transport system permease protein
MTYFKNNSDNTPTLSSSPFNISKQQDKTRYWLEGEPFVWASAAALSIILIFTLLLLLVVVKNGIGVYWPGKLYQFTMTDGKKYLGEMVRTEEKNKDIEYQLKIGNRDLYGLDFTWLDGSRIARKEIPVNAITIERYEYGNFYGTLKGLKLSDIKVKTEDKNSWQGLTEALKISQIRLGKIEELNTKIKKINQRVEKIDKKLAKLTYQNQSNSDNFITLNNKRKLAEQQFQDLLEKQNIIINSLKENKAVFLDITGKKQTILLMDIFRTYQPNKMSIPDKLQLYFTNLWELFWTEPRESNTEGGLFPAIFGTILLIFLMALSSFPLGVIGGIYLREYAKDGLMVRMVRIAVNNLAGIPSIVYGIFGLSFFVYTIGGSIDSLFFPEHLPTPTFGTGGILWASLTLGLLTVPVVIVSTEEALGAIPNGFRESSMAMGATKFQTLTRILIPMASQGIMTGFILAMARAAGEVAPLMITGVVKLAPAMPLDTVFPFLHPERKFMHLGFHIYDIGFQSPNVEAAKPMVFVTTLLLLGIILLLTSTAIILRNKMKQKYSIVL